jgi:carbonic anhydrase
MTSPTPFASETERALAENVAFASAFDRSKLGLPPARKLAVLACMDARITVEDVLGLRTGDAHVIRNAGGLATDDAVRSLVLSHHLLGTGEIIVIGHTGCGMLTFEDGPVLDQIANTTGHRIDMALGSFRDLEANVRRQVDRIRAHPWTREAAVTGVVYDVETGELRQVDEPQRAKPGARPTSNRG